MAFDLRNQAVQRRTATGAAALATPGKRTLTDQLPASPASFTGGTPAASSGRDSGSAQSTGTGDPPPLDARGQVIDNLLNSFQSIDIEVPLAGAAAAGAPTTTHVHVKPPYWNNKYVTLVDGKPILEPPIGFDSGVRAEQLAKLGIDPRSAVASGKARPHEIADAVNKALAAKLIGSTGSHPVAENGWAPAIEAWLLKVGIGIDCNGFVYEALQDLHAAGARTTHDVGGPNGILDVYPTEDSGRTTASIDAMVATGTNVTPPDGLQVADLMVLVGEHVRIIMQVDRADLASRITRFTTAESTADGRTSGGDPVHGPRIHYWRYAPNPDDPSQPLQLQERYEGSQDRPEDWSAKAEKPLYKRHLAPPEAKAGGDAKY